MTRRAAWPVENSAACAAAAASKTRIMLFMQCDSIVDSLRLLKIIASIETNPVLRAFHLLLLFAVASPAAGRVVITRLYANQSPSQLTLVHGGASRLLRAGQPSLRVTGPWQVSIPGQDKLALSYPLEIRTRNGGLALTVAVPLEEYVSAALAGESAVFHSDQALAAMAVVARTYAVRFEGRHRSEGYDFCETTHCQDIRSSAVTERLRRSAEATESELLWFEGSPAATFYAKDCGGATEAAAVAWPDLAAPYLKRHDDPYCRNSAGWTAAIPKQEVWRALEASGIRVPPRLNSLRIAERTASGRALRLQSGGLVLSASSLRFAIGRALGWSRIRSDLYELSEIGANFVFEGRGSGHGVGLCQAGAAHMGEEGRSYRQILDFYYPGTALGVAAQGFPWRQLGGERVDVITTKPGEDGFLVGVADRL